MSSLYAGLTVFVIPCQLPPSTIAPVIIIRLLYTLFKCQMSAPAMTNVTLLSGRRYATIKETFTYQAGFQGGYYEYHYRQNISFAVRSVPALYPARQCLLCPLLFYSHLLWLF